MKATNNRAYLRVLVGTAIFAALAYVVMLVIHIPVQFLTFDAKDAVITVAGFIYGPVSAVAISLVVALVEMLSVSGTGPWGCLMNFLSSAVFSGTAALLYKRFRSPRGAIGSLSVSIVLTTGAMMILNLLVTPLYLGVPVAAVREQLLPLLLPFNFAKACMNASVAMLLYKPTVTAMRRAGLAVASDRAAANASTRRPWQGRVTLWIALAALALAAVAVTVFVLLRR